MSDIIEMNRLGDGAVYRFAPAAAADGALAYKRIGKDVWIFRRAGFGWVVWDAENNALMGRPWDVAMPDQGDAPPACEWVSKRGANSYVYRLVFVSG